MPTLKTAVFLAPDGRKCAIGVKSIETLGALQLLDGKSVTTIRKTTFSRKH